MKKQTARLSDYSMGTMKGRYPHKYTDLSYLREIANGNNEFIVQMLTIFIEQIPHSLTRIETAVHNKDWETLRMVVHKIKPSILFVGLNEIKEDVPKLEKYAAERSNLENVPAIVAKVKAVCTEAISELKEEQAKLK